MNPSNNETRAVLTAPKPKAAEKKPYQKPELTKHQLLHEITLGIQCSTTPCLSPQDPFS